MFRPELGLNYSRLASIVKACDSVFQRADVAWTLPPSPVLGYGQLSQAMFVLGDPQIESLLGVIFVDISIEVDFLPFIFILIGLSFNVRLVLLFVLRFILLSIFSFSFPVLGIS